MKQKGTEEVTDKYEVISMCPVFYKNMYCLKKMVKVKISNSVKHSQQYAEKGNVVMRPLRTNDKSLHSLSLLHLILKQKVKSLNFIFIRSHQDFPLFWHHLYITSTHPFQFWKI